MQIHLLKICKQIYCHMADKLVIVSFILLSYNNAKCSLADEHVVYTDKFNRNILWQIFKSNIKILILKCL